MPRYTCWIASLLLAATAAAHGQTAPAPPSPDSLGAIPGDRTTKFRLIINSDYTKAAAIDQWGDQKKWYVVMDNLVWEFYTDLDLPSAQFAGDGRNLSLLAKFEGEWYLVTNNKSVRKFGTDPVRGLVFSRDGKRDACILTRADGDHVLLEGKLVELPPSVPPRRRIESVVFSADSAHHAFVALAEGKAFLIRDGKVVGTAPADSAGDPVFTDDSKHVLTNVLSRDEKGAAISRLTDEKLEPLHRAHVPGGDIALVAQSADGMHVAWAEQGPANATIYRDGEVQTIRLPAVDCIALSRDGKQLAIGGGNTVLIASAGPKESDTSIKTDKVMELAFSDSGTSLTVRGKDVRSDYLIKNSAWVGPKYIAEHSGARDFEKVAAVQASDSQTVHVILELPRSVQTDDKTIHEIRAVHITDKK